MIPLILAAYLAYGLYLARRMRWTDTEWAVLPAGLPQLRVYYRESWGVPLPIAQARLAYRLPGAYWVYTWTRFVPERRQRALGRAFSLALSLPGVAVMLVWADALGGPWAAAGAGLMLLSSATLVGSYATASYEGLVASCWMIGLYAWAMGAPWVGVACGVTLALLRHTSAWQALVLAALCAGWAYWPLTVAYGAWLFRCHRPVFDSLTGRGTIPGSVVRDGWRYGARVLVQRYEAFVGWAALGVLAWPPVPPMVWALVLVVGIALVGQHAQRTWWRPKWIVGYLPDFALPVLVVLGVIVAPVLATPVGGIAAAVVLAWGLMRRRHPAL